MNKRIIPYFTMYAILLLVVYGLLVTYPKAQLHLMLNSWHTRVGDTFFYYYSQLAEWPLYLIALVPIALHKWRWTAFYAICEVVAAIIVTAIKWTIDIPRPVEYFKLFPELHLSLVPGVTMHSTSTFPSGHACTFFIFFTIAAMFLAMLYQKEEKTLPHIFKGSALQHITLLSLLLLASLGGFSRVYLSQHFVSDIAAGSLIGIMVICLIYWTVGKKIIRYDH